jgi:integrase
MTSAKITKREMKRKRRTGEIVTLTRYVLNYRDPKTGTRTQRFFERQKEAQEAHGQLLLEIKEGTYAKRRDVPTVEQAFDHWLEDRRGQIKPRTLRAYEDFRPYIVGPLLIGTKQQRVQYGFTGKLPEGCSMREMLGRIKLTELTTAEIRIWAKLVADQVGQHTSNKARVHLGTILALAAEDFNVRPPLLPKRTGRGKHKEKKAILTPAQVKTLLEYAQRDKDYGTYIAFPFLTGTRPSEQLGLLWDDVDFEKRLIHIRRMQEINGSITNVTKTSAGTRTIPMSNLLHDTLLEWKPRCPHRDSQPRRVFPNIGFRAQWPKPRKAGGGPLLYGNFRGRVWRNALRNAGVPYVTPHSARHGFISTLQAQGVELGLVAALVGHSNATVTLGVYTQAVRGGEDAVEALARAFQPDIVAGVPPPVAG